MTRLIPAENIERRIYVLRGHRIMLDNDLAELYGVPTKVLNQAVKRNQNRFPKDFVFRLNNTEMRAVFSLRSQIVTLKRGQHLKYAPRAFTEHGAIMLASVLKSSRAARVSIEVVRAFIRLRQILATNQQLAQKIGALEKQSRKHGADIAGILTILHKLLAPPPLLPKRSMGFSVENPSQK